MKNLLIICVALTLATGHAAPAAAHIVLADQEAAPAAYYAGFFRVSHGCEGSPTTRLRIEIPDGINMAKPQPKPGWTISVERAPLATPVMLEGREITERISAITWSGELADDQFDQFGIMMRLPARTGHIYFPAEQTCRSGERLWTEIPAEGQAWHELESPAPVLMLVIPTDEHMDHGH